MKSEHFDSEKGNNSEEETLRLQQIITECASLKADIDDSIEKVTTLKNINKRLIDLLDKAKIYLEDMVAQQENKANIHELLIQIQKLGVACIEYNLKITQQKLPFLVLVDILAMVKIIFNIRLPIFNDEDLYFKKFNEDVKKYICGAYSQNEIFKGQQDTGSNFALGNLQMLEMLDAHIEKSANKILQNILKQRTNSDYKKEGEIDIDDFKIYTKAMFSGNFDQFKKIFWNLYDKYESEYYSKKRENPKNPKISHLIYITLRAISVRNFTGQNKKKALTLANDIFYESVHKEFFLPIHSEIMMIIYTTYKKPLELLMIVNLIIQEKKISPGFIKKRISVCLNVSGSIKTKQAYQDVKEFYLSFMKPKSKIFAGFEEMDRIQITCIMIGVAVNNGDKDFAISLYNGLIEQESYQNHKLLIDSNAVSAFHKGDIPKILEVYKEHKVALNQFNLHNYAFLLLSFLAQECASDKEKYSTIGRPIVAYLMLNNKLNPRELIFLLSILAKANDFEFLVSIRDTYLSSYHDVPMYYFLIDAYYNLAQKSEEKGEVLKSKALKSEALNIINTYLPPVHPTQKGDVKIYDFHGVSVNYIKVFLEDLLPKLADGNYHFITGKGNHTNEKAILDKQAPLKRAVSDTLIKFNDYVQSTTEFSGAIQFRIKKPIKANEVSSPSGSPKSFKSSSSNPWKNKTIKELPLETNPKDENEPVPPLVPIAEAPGSEMTPPTPALETNWQAVATPEKSSIMISAEKAKPAPWKGAKPSENASIEFFSASLLPAQVPPSPKVTEPKVENTPSKMSPTLSTMNAKATTFVPKTNSPQNPAFAPYQYADTVVSASASATNHSFFLPKSREQEEKDNQASWDALMQEQLVIVQKKKENQIATVQEETEGLQEETETYEEEWSSMVNQQIAKNK